MNSISPNPIFFEGMVLPEYETVSSGIKICVECGSRTIRVDNYKIYCKDCNLIFKIKEIVHGA